MHYKYTCTSTECDHEMKWHNFQGEPSQAGSLLQNTQLWSRQNRSCDYGINWDKIKKTMILKLKCYERVRRCFRSSPTSEVSSGCGWVCPWWPCSSRSSWSSISSFWPQDARADATTTEWKRWNIPSEWKNQLMQEPVVWGFYSILLMLCIWSFGLSVINTTVWFNWDRPT